MLPPCPRKPKYESPATLDTSAFKQRLRPYATLYTRCYTTLETTNPTIARMPSDREYDDRFESLGHVAASDSPMTKSNIATRYPNGAVQSERDLAQKLDENH
ncbi:hypothetical protein E4U54_007000 [Claviceps lovelessii]|nr:hypothetical protein E4U54_007000 [Claviceps lovelessii]